MRINLEALKPWTSRAFRRFQSAPVATNSAFLFANSVLVTLLGAVFWTVAARFYSLEAIGRTSAVVSSATLIALISNLGLSSVVIRYLPTTSGDAELHLSITASLIPGILATGIAFVLFSLPAAQSIIAPAQSVSWFRLIPVCLAIAIAVSMVQHSIFIAHKESFFVLAMGLGGALARLVLLKPLANFGAVGLIGAFAVSALAGLSLGARAWKKRVSHNSTGPQASLREMAIYGATTYASGILSQAPPLLYPVLIATQVSPVAAGAFNYAWLVAAVIMTLPPSAANVLLAHLVSSPNKPPQRLHITLFGVVGVTALLAGLGYAVAWVIAPIVLPQGAQDVLKFLPLLLGAVVFYAMVRMQSMVLAWRGHLRELLTLNALVSSVGIGLPIVLLLKSGVLGLECGWLVSQLLGTIVGHVAQSRAMRKQRHA